MSINNEGHTISIVIDGEVVEEQTLSGNKQDCLDTFINSIKDGMSLKESEKDDDEVEL